MMTFEYQGYPLEISHVKYLPEQDSVCVFGKLGVGCPGRWGLFLLVGCLGDLYICPEGESKEVAFSNGILFFVDKNENELCEILFPGALCQKKDDEDDGMDQVIRLLDRREIKISSDEGLDKE